MTSPEKPGQLLGQKTERYTAQLQGTSKKGDDTGQGYNHNGAAIIACYYTLERDPHERTAHVHRSPKKSIWP